MYQSRLKDASIDKLFEAILLWKMKKSVIVF